MFKQLITLVRGRSEDVTQSVLDANALTILRQQLRDAAVGVQKSRKALAVVMAYSKREKATLAKLTAQIGDLEARAMAALGKDEEALALEASAAIANLEAEAAATRTAIDTYTVEINRLRKTLKDSEAQLTELKRGQRLAEASDKARSLRGAIPNGATNGLANASETLKKLKDRQEHAHATAAAITELSTQENADTVSDRLAAAGCGEAKKSDAAAVLERLKAAKKA